MEVSPHHSIGNTELQLDLNKPWQLGNHKTQCGVSLSSNPNHIETCRDPFVDLTTVQLDLSVTSNMVKHKLVVGIVCL